MKASIKKASIAGIIGLATLGVMSTSAMGFGGMMGKGLLTPEEQAARQMAMFTQQASLIGATVDEVKNAWADEKSYKKLATEKGVTKEQLQAKMKVLHDAQIKAHLAALLSKGIITQAQADKRLAYMQTKSAQKISDGNKGWHKGGHKGDDKMHDNNLY